MKTILTVVLCLLAVVGHAANPSTKSFRGAGGVLVTSNDVTGLIVIDGSGVVASGTNSSMQVSTNGTAASVMATNINFIAGTNLVVRGTNVGSTADIYYKLADSVSLPGSLVVVGAATFDSPAEFNDDATFNNGLIFSSGAVNGHVMTSDAIGVASWAAPSGGASTVLAGQSVTVATNVSAYTVSVGLKDLLMSATNRIVFSNGVAIGLSASSPTNDLLYFYNTNGTFPGLVFGTSLSGGFDGVGFRSPAGGGGTLDVISTYSTNLGTLRMRSIHLTNGAAAGYVLTSDDTTGLASWQPPSSGSGTLVMTNLQTTLAVIDGDSQSTSNYLITEGYGLRWSDVLSRMHPWTNVVFTNKAVNFRSSSNNLADFDTTTALFFTNGPYQKAVWFGWFGYADLILGHAPNTIILNLSNSMVKARAAGYSVVVPTIQQGGGSGYLTNGGTRTVLTTNRWTVNNWLRTTGGVFQLYDRLIDIEAIFTNAAPAWSDNEGDYVWDQFDTNYNTLNFAGGDLTHWNALAHSIVAAHVASNDTRWATQPLGVNGGTGTGRYKFVGDLFLPFTGPTAGKFWTSVGTDGLGSWSNAPAGNPDQFAANAVPTLKSGVNLTNLVLAIPSSGNIVAVDANGATFRTNITGGSALAGHSNAIPFINPQGTGLTYYDPGNNLTNPGFGFDPRTLGGPNAGFAGLMVFSDSPMGLVTIGHPNLGSDFATMATALVVSNRYNSAADYQNDQIKIEAVMIGGGLSSTSTMTRWRVWQGTASSNDVASVDVSGLVTVTGFKMTNDAARNRNLKSDANGVGSWGAGNAGGNGNAANVFAPAGGIQFAQTNATDQRMVLDSTNTFVYSRVRNEMIVTNTGGTSNTVIGAGYIKTQRIDTDTMNVNILTASNGFPAFGSDGWVQYADNGTNKAEAAFSYDDSENLLTAPAISTFAIDATQILHPMPTITVVGANSNQTVWAGLTNTVDMLLSTNVTFTNFLTSTAKSGTYLAFMKVTNSAGNIGVNWGLGAGYGKYVFTNANNPIWTTLTNTKTYAASWTFRGTNVHLRLSLEE